MTARELAFIVLQMQTFHKSDYENNLTKRIMDEPILKINENYIFFIVSEVVYYRYLACRLNA